MTGFLQAIPVTASPLQGQSAVIATARSMKNIQKVSMDQKPAAMTVITRMK
jgi:hypothetical protein